ncbi:ATP-binding protein [Eisenibacter elegans]|jgi:serine/threonine-protein kinase RsbW|uniref:ATP-binding protein n=1 Tax=Eisenibacter elegans TaxID=997 RepID=UPI00047B7773|nr:ATP-binding protein [Eisenibacter elegans]
MQTFQIQIPSLVENIRIVESFIDNIKNQCHINDDIYGNIMVAVTESVNNAIIHGNAQQKDNLVRLSVQVNQNQVRFMVEDEGPGFDYTNLADPTAPENIDKPGGRGIFLMKHLCDEVNFTKEGACVEMIFYV